ncbi:transcriptional regulator [Marivirga lumbricoides]|uniref:Transcriptional regulator n=1 Tax=Marivirga lumbricoides TaxID=1046115 RepID=A0A2T4DW08_9BACT|nr:transcriptional regulator [Marivirga lumbricoides]
MPEKTITRLKAFLAEKGRTNNWLVKSMNNNFSTISTWYTNNRQLSKEVLVEIASNTVNIDVKNLIVSTIN